MFEHIVLQFTSSLRARTGSGRRHAHTAATTLIACVIAAAFPALASARSRASCDFRIHVRLSSPLTGHPSAGTFHATRLGTANCAGTLANRFVDGTGWLEGSGSYTAGTQTVFGPLGRCWLDSGSIGFLAAPPVFLSTRSFIRMSSTLTMTATAGALLLSGAGRAGPISPLSPGSERITSTGVGAFRPDRGQICMRTPITSGTLTMRLVVTGPR